MSSLFRFPEAIKQDGAELDDPTALLQGSGKRMRHVKVKPGVDLDDASLDALIRAVYADIK